MSNPYFGHDLNEDMMHEAFEVVTKGYKKNPFGNIRNDIDPFPYAVGADLALFVVGVLMIFIGKRLPAERIDYSRNAPEQLSS